MRLYDILREQVGLSPIAAIRWIHGPMDLPASRLQNFMDERRRRLNRHASA